MSHPLIVLKFGSSVLRTSADLPGAVHEIFRYVRDGFGVVAVVSAFEGVTDRLIGQATALGADPAHDVGVSGLAALVASGERETAGTLQIALSRSGLLSNVVDPSSARLRVKGDGLTGTPVDVDADRLRSLLEKGRIVIVPGFFGIDDEDNVSLLGRGGSDWTALFLAQRLQARCRLIKDTDGIFERDPNADGAAPLRFERLRYADALALGAPVVQAAALEFARSHRQTFEVASLGSDSGTTVGASATLLQRGLASAAPRLRVTLLGLGAVGRGVYELLLGESSRFEVVAIAVRNKAKHAAEGVAADLLFSLDEAIHVPSDVVIEAIGGVDPAAAALAAALESGRHVISANKSVIAAHGVRLGAIALAQDVTLSHSAAVGGIVPVLEALRWLAEPVVSIEGILNGTSNFVLDRLGEGAPIEQAIAEARELGYAEADPSDDLSGLDAARKLTLLARAAFGVEIEAESIPKPGVHALAEWRPTDGAKQARLVARLVINGSGDVDGSVALQRVEATHPLARCRGANNLVVITLKSGRSLELAGRGAGRWPTAESVVGDLFELWRALTPSHARSTDQLGRLERRAS